MLGKQEAGLITSRIKTKIFFVVFIVLSFLAVSSALCAQSRQNGPVIQDANSPGSSITAALDIDITDTAANITLEQIQTLKKSISDSQELSSEIKAKIDEIYNQAITQLQLALELEAKKQDYSQRRKNAPVDLEKAKEQLANQVAFTEPEVAADITLPQAEEKLTEITLALEQAKKNASNLENEPKKRTERKTKIPEELNTAKQKLEEIKAKLKGVAAEGQTPELVQANRTLLMAQQRALESQMATNTEELLCYDTRREVLAANRDLAARQLASAEKLAEFWQQKVNEMRQKQAQAAQKEAIRAKEETRYARPAIQEIAEKNVELAKQQTELVAKVEKTSQDLKRIDEQLAALENDFSEVREKVKKAGKITGVMGVLLQTKRKELPDIRENKKLMKSRLSDITQAQLKLIQYDKEWSELSNIEQQAQNIVNQIEPPLTDTERDGIRNEVVNYLQNTRKTLQTISDLYLDY